MKLKKGYANFYILLIQNSCTFQILSKCTQYYSYDYDKLMINYDKLSKLETNGIHTCIDFEQIPTLVFFFFCASEIILFCLLNCCFAFIDTNSRFELLNFEKKKRFLICYSYDKGKFFFYYPYVFTISKLKNVY